MELDISSESINSTHSCASLRSLSLNVMTLLPRCESVETRLGVALTVTGVAQVMVMAADHLAEGYSATATEHSKRGTSSELLESTGCQVYTRLLQFSIVLFLDQSKNNQNRAMYHLLIVTFALSLTVLRRRVHAQGSGGFPRQIRETNPRLHSSNA